MLHIQLVVVAWITVLSFGRPVFNKKKKTQNAGDECQKSKIERADDDREKEPSINWLDEPRYFLYLAKKKGGKIDYVKNEVAWFFF